MTFKKVEKILIKNGWIKVRTSGSHVQFKKEDINFLATVPNHGGKDISVGVLTSLEKGTGLSLKNR
ncbi:type II toxin-antitoxin system HicA family toxin [Bacillus sp. REN16]|uniref:type II toxin-antitoxin system HicA family toxin n=1 Tax=Bacillus sp. REN16 TaxID=2887296 RepID=UPI001E46FEB4|nr:type II toxin-antitoxin system HicA family toxin [Bacillus sp. REN16]MCC3359625.1 type II toxin-antitoxin system HicA family toxin [Bacillus sp. REN16]